MRRDLDDEVGVERDGDPIEQRDSRDDAAGIQYRRHEHVAEHERMRATDPHARRIGQLPQPPGRVVPVRPASASVQQDRAVGPALLFLVGAAWTS
jgi:hypothetical protein